MHDLASLTFKENLGNKMKLKEPGRQKSQRQIFLAVGEACKSIFCRTAGFEERTSGNFGFSVEGAVVCVFAVPPAPG